MTKFNVTYEIVTEESVEHGDAEERGFIAAGVSLRDAIDYVTETRTNEVNGVITREWSGHDRRWLTIINGMEYRTGAQESRSLHIPDSVTEASRGRIGRLLGVYRP